MPTLDDIEWNELPVVALHNGQVSVWRAWKRQIAAFVDPAVWQDPTRLAQYFEPLDDDRWGPAGYGIIVIDYDRKHSWSFNDFSHPGLFHLPADNVLEQDPSVHAGLHALLADSTQWPHVKLTLGKRGPAGIPLPGGKMQDYALHALLPVGTTSQQAIDALQVRRGMVKLGGSNYLSMGGEYAPAGWTLHDDRGAEMPHWFLDALRAWKASGLHAPDWNCMDTVMEAHELPVAPHEVENMLEGEDDPATLTELRQMQALAREYVNLKYDWGWTPEPNPRRPGL